MKKAILILAMLVGFHNSAMADYMTSEQFSQFTKEQKHWWYVGAFTNI